jgi:hypothetical protein
MGYDVAFQVFYTMVLDPHGWGCGEEPGQGGGTIEEQLFPTNRKASIPRRA